MMQVVVAFIMLQCWWLGVRKSYSK